MGPVGALFVLLSAVGFGLLAVFAKLAYGEGVGVDQLMMVRFGLAAVLLVAIAGATRSLDGLSRRTVLIGFAMGAIGYSTQAGLYLTAVSRTDASLVTLLFSTYPVLVMVGAIALRRDRASARRMIALVTALAGIALVLDGVSQGHVDPLGAALALGSALVYTCYILVGERVADAHPLPLTAVVCTGAGVTSALRALIGGHAVVHTTLAGWSWLLAVVLVSTVGAILLFFAGLARVGPTETSLLSVLEPVVTVMGAALVFGERLGVAQALGGALVLAAVVLVQLPARARGARPDDVLLQPEPAVP